MADQNLDNEAFHKDQLGCRLVGDEASESEADDGVHEIEDLVSASRNQ